MHQNLDEMPNEHTHSVVFVPVTMWHEGYEEIKNSVVSLTELAKAPQSKREQVDYYFHFFVDDGVKTNGVTS